MKRVIILLLDSFGVGASPDAQSIDEGANTLAHIAISCALGEANQLNLRHGPLQIPNLLQLGLGNILAHSSNRLLPTGLISTQNPSALWGYAQPLSLGKDTPSGHWEIAGVPVRFAWHYFPDTTPCFPQQLIDEFLNLSDCSGILGNKHASGTEIIAELGKKHIETLKPIVYTSADSVFQIAAHEHYFGLEKLYKICEIARKLLNPYNVGRVIARPFIGEVGNFKRTANRRDYAIPPPENTLLDKLIAAKKEVIAIGKVADIFSHRGISQTIKAPHNDALFKATCTALSTAADHSLIFTNLVDFDTLYGHRRDVAGYAHALECFDRQLPLLINQLQAGDLCIITADHGCDPTWMGSDHTREYIPILAFGPNITPRCIGKRKSFADIGQSIASYLEIPALNAGETFL